jgi:hypothetical protein
VLFARTSADLQRAESRGALKLVMLLRLRQWPRSERSGAKARLLSGFTAGVEFSISQAANWMLAVVENLGVGVGARA